MRRKRSSSGSQTRAATRRAARRHVKRSSSQRAGTLLVLAIAVLLALTVLVPSGQASEGMEAEIQAATREATKAAEKENLRMQREAAQNARRQARRDAREPIRLANKERENGVVSMSCSEVTINYRNFPDLPGNTVVEYLKIRGKLFAPIIHTFDGTSSTETIPIVGPVGHYLVDVHAKWRTNGLSGNFDIPGNVTCGPAPAYTIEKLQAIGGSGLPATTAPLTGQVGQTVDYEIRVTNTGNTPLTFSNFEDKHCDPGTLGGGSGETPVEPLAVVTFMCSHKLTAADETAGSYTNTATVTGTPEPEEGSPETHESNTVEVTPITPHKEEEKAKEKTPETPATTPTTTPTGGVLGTSSSTTPAPKSGVLGFASATVPALKGPQGCVRSAFTASIRSAGVSSVTFYLDGKKLKTLSSKSSHKGLLSIRIDPSSMKVGAHHVVAKITMKKSSSTAAAVHATRSLTVIRCHVAVVTPHFTG
jgi:hypothetical protein